MMRCVRFDRGEIHIFVLLPQKTKSPLSLLAKETISPTTLVNSSRLSLMATRSCEVYVSFSIASSISQVASIVK